MHVAPSAYLFCAFDVIVGNIHTASIGNLAVDDDNLTMIARPDMVDPRETDGIEFDNVDAVGTELLEMMFLEGLIVRVVAETVEHSSYLDTLSAFLAENLEEEHSNRVVAEIEIL